MDFVNFFVWFIASQNYQNNCIMNGFKLSFFFSMYLNKYKILFIYFCFFNVFCNKSSTGKIVTTEYKMNTLLYTYILIYLQILSGQLVLFFFEKKIYLYYTYIVDSNN